MPAYNIVTFGCQMNQHDSERIGEVLRAAGYVEVGEPAAADLVLLNTCSIREKAEHKLRSEVGRLGMLKRIHPGLVIAVAGCVAQQEGERLLERMPQIDLMIGPDNIAELPSLLADLELGGLPRVRTVFDLDAPTFLSARPELGRQGPTAYVTIMKGCNERCSFCIVPHTRGPERYRPAREILSEIERLVVAGVREVTLLGQTVNSYRDPEQALPAAPGAGEGTFVQTRRALLAEDETEFPALLRVIAERVPGLERLRYTSPHPRHLTWALIRAHQDLAVLARHVHLPVQSGSDRLLKRMLRRYSVAEYLERVRTLREAVPGLTLSTDVIVGFPGETDADFAATLALVDGIGFTGVFAFEYSVRPYTPAKKLEDDVSPEQKSARLQELIRVADAYRRQHLQSRIGATERVLAERVGRDGGFSGRSERNEIVHFSCPGMPLGRIVPVHITEAFRNSLRGEAEPAWAEAFALRDAASPAPRSSGPRSLPVFAGP